MRAALEREAEAGLKLQLQQKDFEWRQKCQVRAFAHAPEICMHIRPT